MKKPKNKYIIIGISLSIVSLLFILFWKPHLTEAEYDNKVIEFNTIFDKISTDFYTQCKLSSSGNIANKNLNDIYEKDVDNLDNILEKYDEKSIPTDKRQDFKERQSIPCLMSVIKGQSISKTKINETACNEFILFYEKRAEELGNTVSSTNIQTTTQTENKFDLEVLDKTTSYNNGSTYIIGTIINNSKNNYTLASVSINLYDDSDNIVGNAIDNIQNLGSGEKWKFKCNTTVEFKKFKIMDVHGYTN